MKLKIILLIILSQFLFSEGEHIIINGIKFSVSKISKQVLCKYISDEYSIYKFFDESNTGTIKIYDKSYEETLEIIEDYKTQESKPSQLYYNEVNENIDIGVLFSKNRKHAFPKLSYRFKNKKIIVLRFSLFQIHNKISDDKIEMTMNNHDYQFDETGKLTMMYLENWDDKAWSVFKYKYNDNFLEVAPRLCPGVGHESIGSPIVSKSKILETDYEISEYIKENNYKISYYEAINDEKVKTMEIKFNENNEIIELFIRKIDPLDNTIGGTIMMKFDKGTIISEERGE
jgi:hypothetical protein